MSCMTLHAIYAKYSIPPNLVRHQLQVAAVGKYVCEHWHGPTIDTENIVKTLLLHDLGNIVKFHRPFLGELEPQAAYWESVQAECVARYGTDANNATEAILTELGLTKILSLLVAMKAVWVQPEMLAPWEARIAEYADTCVTPIGIEGFETRMADLANRYGHTQDTAVYQAMKQNADLIQEHVDVDLENLSKLDFGEEMEELQKETF